LRSTSLMIVCRISDELSHRCRTVMGRLQLISPRKVATITKRALIPNNRRASLAFDDKSTRSYCIHFEIRSVV